MCWMCDATNDLTSELLWTKRGWRRTIKSHETYLLELRAKGLPIPALFLIVTLRLEGVALDCLHVADQGISSHIIANALVEIMGLGHWGSTQHEQAQNLQADIQRWYKTKPLVSRIQGRLSYERLKTSGDWPKLKAKGAATRHLAAYAAEITNKYNHGSVHDKQRHAICHLLNRFYEIIAEQTRQLSNEAKAEMRTISEYLVSIYISLADEALSKGVRMWKMTAKCHAFQHLLETQACTLINPAYSWNYSSEDLQRVMKDIALSCHKNNMSFMVVYKWLTDAFDECGD